MGNSAFTGFVTLAFSIAKIGGHGESQKHIGNTLETHCWCQCDPSCRSTCPAELPVFRTWCKEVQDGATSAPFRTRFMHLHDENAELMPLLMPLRRRCGCTPPPSSHQPFHGKSGYRSKSFKPLMDRQRSMDDGQPHTQVPCRTWGMAGSVEK